MHGEHIYICLLVKNISGQKKIQTDNCLQVTQNAEWICIILASIISVMQLLRVDTLEKMGE